jgi:hypothetical protein
VAALLADPTVSAIVGQRVYLARGPFGGISRELTPEAFSDGDLLTSVVVRMESRDAIPGRPIGGAIVAVQVIALWVYDQHSYDPIFEVIRAARRLLDRAPPPAPVADAVAWAETVWQGDGPEVLDAAMEPPCPVVTSRYAATIRELEVP